jgi:hypothetical protein
MKLLIAVSLLVAAFVTLTFLPAGADDNEGGVLIMITPKVISITVDQSVLDYGSPQIGTTDNRPSPVGFNVSNNGTTSVKLQIAGTDTVGAGSGDPGWELANAVGDDTYVHRYAVDLSDPLYPGEFGIMDEVAQEFLTSLATSTSANIKLSLDMPTSTSTTAPQEATVTIIASEATP